MALKGEERRKHIRAFLSDGQVRMVSGLMEPLVGRVIDVSLSGMRIMCQSELAPGEDFKLELTLPSGLRFSCQAVIIHGQRMPGDHRHLYYGVQFADMSCDDRAKLGDYIMATLSASRGGDKGRTACV